METNNSFLNNDSNSIEYTSRFSQRVRKPRKIFTLESLKPQEDVDDTLVHYSCEKPFKQPSQSFSVQNNCKIGKILEKSLKELKLNLKDRYIVVYFCKETKSNK